MFATHQLVLALVAVSFATVQCQSFCRSYKCPSFTDSKKYDGFEVRSYAASKWVGVSKESDSADGVVNGMFMNLFRYIQGGNAAGMSIKMTVPVITKVDAIGGGRYMHTMMFYLDVENPPAPNDANVKIIDMPAQDVYVRSFYKWFMLAKTSDFINEADELRTSIAQSGAPATYNSATYYQVSYASPWWPIRKYHEVWLA